MNRDELKKKAGEAVVDIVVKSGMKVGLGTGSTAIWAVRRIGELLKKGKLKNIFGVPTSLQTEIECQKLEIPLKSLNSCEINGYLDIAIDGADEIDREFNLTKGGGGALLIEKIVAYSAEKFFVVAEENKMVKSLGISFPIPLEIVPESRASIIKTIKTFSGKPELRMAVKKMGPVITDNGNMIVDVTFDDPFDPCEYEKMIAAIPGVVENGIFSFKKPELFLVQANGQVVRKSVDHSF